ncbi:MAG: hypothetical protein R3B81_08355 [bacterium]
MSTRSEKRRAAWAALGRGGDAGGTSRAPFLGIHFTCCGVYGRIYRTRDRRAYEGRCPRCLARLRVPIGDGGVAQRFFRAI